MTFFRLAVVAVFCGLGLPVAAEDVRSGIISDSRIRVIDAAVQQQMEDQQLTGVAIGILQDGKLVFTRGYGLADREKNVPVSSQTVFNWASNSKPVVALIAMQLHEQGRLDLDADIRDYVPEFPQKKFVVTTRQLLSHQSGIPHYSNGPVVPAEGFLPGDSEHDPVFAIGRFSGSPLIFEPGERFSYSSYAYLLLSAVVQRAAEQPFEQLVRERVAIPLKMSSLQWDVPTEDQPHWAKGYFRTPIRIVVPTPEQAHFWKHGAGGLKSDIVDFGHWAEAVLNGELLSQANWKEMLTIPTPRDGSSTTMALGINVQGENGSLKLSHGGSQAEARSRLVVYPGQRHGMVILCNSSHADTAAISTAIYSSLSSQSKP